MSDLHIFSNTTAKHLLIKHSAAVSSWRITDAAAICQMVGLKKSAYSERLKKAKEKNKFYK